MAKASRVITDTAPNAGAAGSTADTGTAGVASSVSGGAAGPAASETSPAAIAAAQGTAGEDRAGLDLHQLLTLSVEEQAVQAAAAERLAGRPEAMARAAEDVAGSALRAPGVGSGPTAEPLADTRPAGDGFAAIDPALRRETGTVEGGLTVEVGTASGIPPNLMSREGSFGAAEDRRRLEDFGLVVDAALFRTDADDRRDVIRDLAMVAFTGAKLAAPMPKTREGIEALQDEGFDLVVVARQDGFRRAGVAHAAAQTLRRSRDFSVAEIEALSAEPMLIVRALR